MNYNSYIKSVKNNWQAMTVIILGVVVLALVLSLLRPLEYRSRVELLIVQKQNLTLDAYNSARASEKLANTLASVIGTRSFFDKVIEGNFGVQRSDFPTNERKLRKVWAKKVSATVFPESSLLRVDLYDEDRKQADRLATAVASILVNNSSEYHGAGSEVMVKVVNEPLASDYPVRPNVIVNVFTALVVGLAVGLAWVFYLARDRKSLRHEIYEAGQVLTMYDHLS